MELWDYFFGFLDYCLFGFVKIDGEIYTSLISNFEKNLITSNERFNNDLPDLENKPIVPFCQNCPLLLPG